MTYLYELTDYLESIAPLQLQESYDNAGLIIGAQFFEMFRLLFETKR